MFIAAFLVCFIAVVDAIPDDICGNGWIYSYGSCYAPDDEDGGYIQETQAYCKSVDPDSYVMVINTKEEMVAAIENGVVDDGDYLMFGLYTADNGTTWERYDGSTETTYLETVFHYDDTDGVGDHLECTMVEEGDAYCSFYYPDTYENVICEKQGPYAFPEPCNMKVSKKLRRDATRTIRMNNDKPGSCYIEIKGKKFGPAQLKVYGYSVPCKSGFYVQADGEPMEMILRDKFTCGLKSGQGRALMKKRSRRAGTIRLYLDMSGDGKKLKIRAKGRSFK